MSISQLRKYMDIVSESRVGEIDTDFTQEALSTGIAKLATEKTQGRQVILYLVPVQPAGPDAPRLAKIKLAFRGQGQPFDIMIGVVSNDGRYNFTKNDLVKIYNPNMDKPVLNAAQQAAVKAAVVRILKPKLN